MTFEQVAKKANQEYRRAKRAEKHNADPTTSRTQFKRAKSAQKAVECLSSAP